MSAIFSVNNCLELTLKYPVLIFERVKILRSSDLVIARHVADCPTFLTSSEFLQLCLKIPNPNQYVIAISDVSVLSLF